MFVSVILDPGSKETALALTEVLASYGYAKKQRSCWENPSVNEERLTALKKDLDRVTDYYDTLRIYQYPVQDVMAITELVHKKWRKMLLRGAPASTTKS